jgi:hypothetical protein
LDLNLKYQSILIGLICLSTYSYSQTNNDKDLVFRVRSERTTVQVLPDISVINHGSSQDIFIRIRPAGRIIGKVTFKGGNLVGKDSTYNISAGKGAEGILSVYEKTPRGDKLILNKVYTFKKVLVRSKKSDPHVLRNTDKFQH